MTQQASENTPLLEKSKQQVAAEAKQIREKLAAEARLIRDKAEQEKKQREQQEQTWQENKPYNIKAIKDLQIIFSERHKKVLDEYKEMDDNEINKLWDVQFLQKINSNIEKILSQNLNNIPASLIQAETDCLIAQNNLYHEINKENLDALVQAENFVEEQRDAFLSEHSIDYLSPATQGVIKLSAGFLLGVGIMAASGYGLMIIDTENNPVAVLGLAAGIVTGVAASMFSYLNFALQPDAHRQQIAWRENLEVKNNAQSLLSHSHFIVQQSKKLLEEKQDKMDLEQQPGDIVVTRTPSFTAA